MNTYTKDLMAYLQMMAGLEARTPEKFVWAHGSRMGEDESQRVALKPHIVFPKSRQCYLNAWYLHNRRPKQALRYCEGFVMMQDVPIPIMHGWCVDQDMRVLDPSVEQDRPRSYYGVVFVESFAREMWRQLLSPQIEAIGIFGNLWRLRCDGAQLVMGVELAASLEEEGL